MIECIGLLISGLIIVVTVVLYCQRKEKLAIKNAEQLKLGVAENISRWEDELTKELMVKYEVLHRDSLNTNRLINISEFFDEIKSLLQNSIVSRLYTEDRKRYIDAEIWDYIHKCKGTSRYDDHQKYLVEFVRKIEHKI